MWSLMLGFTRRGDLGSAMRKVGRPGAEEQYSASGEPREIGDRATKCRLSHGSATRLS
jgi:hypothetical protein